MTQHQLTTKPFGDEHASSEESAAATPRPRRRLGSWQPAGEAPTGAASPAPDNATITLPLGGERPALGGTNDFAGLAMRATVKFPTSDQLGGEPTASLSPTAAAATVGLAAVQTTDIDVTAALQHGAAASTVPLLERPTSGLADPDLASAAGLLTTRLASRASAPLNDASTPASILVVAPPTIDLQSAPTAAMPALVTEPIGGNGHAVTGEIEAAVSVEDAQLLQRLRDRVALNASDSDALFDLVVALHRLGRRREARDALTKLVGLYKERGQHTQAARIMGMLSSPKTGPFATEELPTPVSPTGPTAPLARRTGSLAGRAGLTGRLGRDGGRSQIPAASASFVSDTLSFTIPLPGEENLRPDVRELVAQSTEDMRAGKLRAAHDLCLSALSLSPEYFPLSLRIAELYIAQKLTRRARVQGETLLRLMEAADDTANTWMVYRVLLHTSENDLPSLRRLVELLIDAGQSDHASYYAAKLIQLLDSEGLSEEALGYSVRLGKLIPGDTRAALENAILLLKNGDRIGALDRWESAVAAGADATIARASVAALIAAENDDDHWRTLADVIPILRERAEPSIVDAYRRTAAVEASSSTLTAGLGLLYAATGDSKAPELLTTAAGDRSGSALARATSAVALAWLLKESGPQEEYVAAVRTAIQLLEDSTIAGSSYWQGLVGRLPRYEELALELGETLLVSGDAAGATEVLARAHARSNHHGPVCERLADAYFRIGQLGSALTILDELAMHYRSTGQLEAMAGVLRQMSQLAPNNIKVKSRLVDAYLQRGFVAEARAELIQRADLEERSGLIKDAVSSLQRAADLSWTMGLADESFAIYHRMIALAPTEAGHRHGLVNLYLQMGRLEDAAEHQRAVVDIALKQNTKHEAIAALHQVIGLTPDDATAYYQLADLLSSIAEYAQAERVYKRLVMMNPADAIAQAKATAMAALKEAQQARV